MLLVKWRRSDISSQSCQDTDFVDLRVTNSGSVSWYSLEGIITLHPVHHQQVSRPSHLFRDMLRRGFNGLSRRLQQIDDIAPSTRASVFPIPFDSGRRTQLIRYISCSF